MRADTLVIVNPAASGARQPTTRALVADYFTAQNRAVAFLESKSSDDLREQAARAAANGFRFVLALGGDGAVHHLIEGLLGTSAIGGILPAGNGNDFARSLGIPLDPIRAADAFLHSSPQSIDVVRVRFRSGKAGHIIAAGGIGLDAEAAHRANTVFRKWPGATRYIAGALTAFFDEAAFDLRAEIDDRSWSGRAIIAVIANGPVYGSGLCIAPEAKMNDGLMDLLLVRDIPWTRLIEAIPILLTSGDVRFKEIERFRCRHLRLAADRPVKVHGDGEYLGESPAEFEVLPKAIRVMAPV